MRCFGTPGGTGRRCHLPLPEPLADPATWQVKVWSETRASEGAFRVTLALSTEARYVALPTAYGLDGSLRSPPEMTDATFGENKANSSFGSFAESSTS